MVRAASLFFLLITDHQSLIDSDNDGTVVHASGQALGPASVVEWRAM